MKNEKHLAEFGGITHFEAFKAAAAFLKKNSGSTLEIPPKKYILSGNKAKKLQSAVMTNAKFLNNIFNRGISLVGIKDCEIKGNGAEILADGFMQTLYLRECENLVISNLKISSTRPAYSIGKVISCEGNGQKSVLKVGFSFDYPLNVNSPIHSAYISLDGKSYDIDTANIKITSNFFAEVTHPLLADFLGAEVCIVHIRNLLDTIRIENCKNITFENVTVTLGSGLILSADDCDGLIISGIYFEAPLENKRKLKDEDISLNLCKNVR